MFCSALTNNIMSKRGFVKLFTHSLHVLLCSHEQHHEQKRFCQVVYPQFTCSALLSRTTSWAKEVLSSCLPTVYMFCSALTNNIMSKRGFVKLFTHSLHVLLCSHEQHHEQKRFCQVVYPQFTCSALLSRTTSWAKEVLSSCLPTVYMFCSALTNNIMSKRGFVKLFTHSLHVLLCSHEQHHEQKRFCQVVYPQFTCSALLSRTTSWAKEVLSSCLPTVYMFCSALTNNIMSKRGFVKLFTHSLHVLLCSHEQHHEQKRFCQVVYPQFTCSALLSRTTSWAKEVLSSCLPTVYMFCSALTNNIMSKRGFVKLFTHSLHVLLCSHEQHHEQKRFCQVVYPQFTCSALLSRTTSWAKEVLSSCLPTVYMFCSALTNNIMSKRGFVKLFTHSLHVLLCSHEQHHEQKRFCQVVYPQFTCSALLSRTTSWAKEVLSSCLPTVYMFCSALTNNIMSKRGFVKLFTHSLHVLLCSHEQHHEQKRFCQVVYPQFTCSALLSRTTSWAKEVLSSCLPTVYMFCSALTNNIMSKRGFVKLFTHSLHVLLCSHEQHHEQKRFCQVVYPQFTCSALLSRTTSWAKEVLSSCLPTVYMFCSALTNNIMSKRGFVKLFTHSLHVLLCSHEQHHEQKRFCQVVYPQFTCSALLSRTTSWAKEVLSSCLPTVYMFCSALTNNIMSKRGFVKLFTHSLHVLLCSHEQHHEQKRFCQVVYPQFTCSALLSRTTSWAKEVLSSCLPTVSALLSRTTSWAKEVLSSCLPTVYMFCSALTNNIMSKRGFVKLFTHSLHVLLCSHEQHHEQKRFCQVVYPQFTCSALLSRTTSWAKEVLSSCLPTVYMFCSALTNNIMSKRGFVKLFTHSLHVLLCSHEQHHEQKRFCQVVYPHSLHVLLCSHEQHHEQKRFCQVVYPQFTCSALLSRTTSWAKEVLSSCLPTVYMFCSALTNNIMSKRGFVKLFTHSLHVLLCSHEQHHEQKRFCQVVYPQFTCSALLSRTTSWAKEVLSSCLPTVYMFCSALTNNIMSSFVKLFTHSLHVLLCSHEQHHEQKRFCQVVYPQFTCSALLSRTTSWAKEVLSSCLPTVYMFCSALTNNIMSKRGFVKLFTHSLHVLLCSHEQHHEQKRFCQVVYPQFTCSALLSRTTSWAKEVLSSCLPTVYMFCSALTNNIMSKRGFVKLFLTKALLLMMLFMRAEQNM